MLAKELQRLDDRYPDKNPAMDQRKMNLRNLMTFFKDTTYRKGKYQLEKVANETQHESTLKKILNSSCFFQFPITGQQKLKEIQAVLETQESDLLTYKSPRLFISG